MKDPSRHTEVEEVLLADRVYVELVRTLYLSTEQAIWMLLVLAGYMIVLGRYKPTILSAVLSGAAFLLWLLRIAVVWKFREMAFRPSIDRAGARRLELAFAGPYLCFSALLGVLAGHGFWKNDAPVHMLTGVVLMGFGAGVAVGVGLRPRIASLSMALAVVPSIVAAAWHRTPDYLITSAIMAIFLAGGVRSLHQRKYMIAEEIRRKLESESRARYDTLTALPNRFRLREYFEENERLVPPKGLVAVHYLDLDGFKPVNDQYGHAMGDLLLSMVADRLRGCVRSTDIIARMGGDEFVVVQFGLGRLEETHRLAGRLVTAIGKPYHLTGERITISACVGTAVSANRADTLEDLLAQADSRLYAAKRRRKPINDTVSSPIQPHFGAGGTH